jgi:2,4-diketo-3-deoxy-L-fuconate hydrolase
MNGFLLIGVRESRVELGLVIGSKAKCISKEDALAHVATGNIISTGTPPGVALGQEPPPYLQAGNIIRFGIDGLGAQRQPIGAGKAE